MRNFSLVPLLVIASSGCSMVAMASPACSMVAIASASFLLVTFVTFVTAASSFELVEEPSCQVVTSQ